MLKKPQSRFFYLIFLGLKKYTNYKMRVAASTTVGESALSEENDVFVRTPEDGKYIVCNDDLISELKFVLLQKTGHIHREGKCTNKITVGIINLLSVSYCIQTIFR